MKSDARKYKVMAIAAVLMMVFSSFVLIQGTSDDSEATSDSWTCTITIEATSITTKYAKNGAALNDTTPVSGNNGNASVGSWGFDSSTGYGPFGSFYAAFDVNTGKIAYRLNPNDLSKALDGTSISSTGYNIMWVLPTVWMKVTDVIRGGDSTLVMSSEKMSGMTAPAHTIDGVVYEYLALGVYEAYDDGSKLYSYPDKSPTNNKSLADFQTHASNTGVYGGHSIVWNFYQWQLYRFCSLAVMENFDSQAQIGYGNVFGSHMNTGTTSTEGPYYGTSSASTTGVKLFIENSWGNLWEYIGDSYWNNGLNAGQNSSQKAGTSTGMNKTTVTSNLGWAHKFGTLPYSQELDSWGLPKANDRNSSSAPDLMNTHDCEGRTPIVGGSWDRYSGGKTEAGLSCLKDGGIRGADLYGTRLAMVFDSDPTVRYSVDYNMDGGSPQIASASILKGDYTISNATPVKKGYIFIGWHDGTKMLNPGDKIIVQEDVTLSAVWAAIKPVIPSKDTGPNVPGKDLRT